MTNEVTNYDELLEEQEHHFVWKGQKYVLREPSGAAVTHYQNIIMGSAEMSKGDVTGVKGMADAEPLLVSECTFHDTGDPSSARNVSLSIVKKWPGRLMDSLFEKAKEFGEFDKEKTLEQLIRERDELNKKIEEKKKGEDPAKNEQDSSMTGSE